MPINIFVGDDGSNNLPGTAGNDLIYGYNPDGPQSQVTSITGTRVATGLSQTLFAGSPPNDTSRLFIVEKTGAIRILDLNSGQILPTPFLDVSTQILTGGEQGLLGLAFDPSFAQNGYFYVNLVNSSGDTEIRRYQVSATNPNQADPTSSTLIIRIDQPDGVSNHKGGWIGFGPDGFLYIALGDGGGGGDPFHNGQSMDSLLAKMLRLDVHSDAFPTDPNRNYAIPSDNPFVGATGADEVWALGLRNPWRPSFDRGTGDFYIADVGQGTWEEIDIGVKGANYGWSHYEGPVVYPGPGGDPVSGGTLTFPIYSYDHSVGQSITGGYVYRGTSEGLHGRYFFADFSQGRVWTLALVSGSWVATERTSQIAYDFGTLNSPSSFGQDALGNLYAVDFDGDIFRLTPNVASADLGDTINAGIGDDLVFGGSGNDLLAGGDGNDELQGGNGDDTLSGDNQSDLLNGGPGNDMINGGAGVDTLVGDVGNDTMDGGVDADRLSGGLGADILNGSAGLDTIAGGGGPDRFVFDNFAYTDATAATPLVDHISDYDRGNGSAYSAAEGDQIDISALTSLGFNTGQTADALVRVVERPDATFADLQVDVDGTGMGAHWVTIAELDDIHLGNAVNTILHPSQPAGVTLYPQSSNGLFGDFNGDGRSDVLWHSDTGSNVLWEMNGHDILATLGVAQLPTNWHIVGLGDFNGDGRSDMLLRNDSGLVGMWEMNGNQILASTTFMTIPASWHVAGIEDFNGDDKADVLWRSDTGSQVLWTMNGHDILATQGVAPLSTSWHIVGLGDFNGDNRSDMLLRNDSGLVAMWEMNGSQVVTSTTFMTIPSNWHVAGVADLNGDNKSDVLWRSDAGSNVLWVMNGHDILATQSVAPLPSNWHVVGLGDFNGDDKGDLFLRNDTGLTAMWEMIGSEVLASATYNVIPNTWSTVVQHYDFV